MKIGLIADTHDQMSRTQTAIDQLLAANVEAIIHLGDVTDAKILSLCTAVPLYFVFGNNDSDNVPALREAGERHGAVCLEWGGMLTLADRTIAVTHGHLHLESRPLLAEAPDYFVFGHSHVATDEMAGETRRINPGALHRADEFSVATLDLCEDQVQFLTVPRT